ncbi:MAG: MerR family transcriptional regulator [Polyangiaceae bacterium]
MKLSELAEAADVAARTIRYYVQRGLLPAPEFRGKDTTYGDEHLLRLRVIRRLQQAHLPLDEIQVRLASASRAELERMASDGIAVPALPISGPMPLPMPRPSPVPGGPYRSPIPGCFPTSRAERWERWVLRPGVELHVRSDADPDAITAAEEIRARFAGG